MVMVCLFYFGRKLVPQLGPYPSVYHSEDYFARQLDLGKPVYGCWIVVVESIRRC
jgi:hypothetical protein